MSSLPEHADRAVQDQLAAAVRDFLAGIRKWGDHMQQFSDGIRIEAACVVMHNAYEAAAVDAGWETQAASRKPWSDVPDANKATMRAAVKALFDWLDESSAIASRDALAEQVEAVRAAYLEAQNRPYDDPCGGDCARCSTWPQRFERFLGPLLASSRETQETGDGDTPS